MNAPPRSCPRCGRTVPAGLECPVHRQASAYTRGYTQEWAAYSRRFLAVYQWCGDHPPQAPETGDSRCKAVGLRTRATQTDHIQPHHSDAGLMWNAANHQALCHPCHARKTVMYDGGFGR
jgi:5-methylcytosine-specific restriction protein A